MFENNKKKIEKDKIDDKEYNKKDNKEDDEEIISKGLKLSDDNVKKLNNNELRSARLNFFNKKFKKKEMNI